jgi:hypothetical protein
MTVFIATVAVIVGLAAAARSTWSPCGLSMLSTITPVSERAKGNHYRSTAAWFVLGATVGGATLGVTLAALAGGVRSLGLSSTTVGVLALGAALLAATSDAGIAGFRLPIHRRQVNERWLDQYRPWVYGAGFGWQIGTGLATYITTAALYLMIVLGVLTADPIVALGVGTGFGVLRGLAVLLTRRVTTPTELRAFHRRFHQAGPWVGRTAVAVEAGAAVAVVGYLRSPVALAMTGAAVAITLASRVAVDKHRLDGAAADSSLTPSAWAGSVRTTPSPDLPGSVGPDDLVDHGARLKG